MGNGYWYSPAECPECNVGPLAFAVRRDGTCYLLCLDCGANYASPPGPADSHPAFDPPPDELMDPPRWATREQIEQHGWSVAGHVDT
jgi:hypothetical protein